MTSRCSSCDCSLIPASLQQQFYPLKILGSLGHFWPSGHTHVNRSLYGSSEELRGRTVYIETNDGNYSGPSRTPHRAFCGQQGRAHVPHRPVSCWISVSGTQRRKGQSGGCAMNHDVVPSQSLSATAHVRYSGSPGCQRGIDFGCKHRDNESGRS